MPFPCVQQELGIAVLQRVQPDDHFRQRRLGLLELELAVHVRLATG
jgi:hypothetical protein